MLRGQVYCSQLLIGGRFGWQTGVVKDAYDNAQFQKDIIFLGYVPDEELPRLTGAALALAYVSLFEGFGVPILEAMHCDIPVITSTSSSMPEVAGAAGYLVDPTVVDQIAIAMQEIWEQPALRQKLINAGREQRQKFSWEKATEVIKTALENVIGHPLALD